MNNIKNKLDKVCSRYRAVAADAIFLDDIIVVPVKGGALHLVFDKDCNILGIDNINNPDYYKPWKDYFIDKYSPNKKDEEDDMFLDLMSDSFTSYSLGMIQNISNKTYFSTKNCFFKGKLIDDKYLEELLSYFAFLGEEIKFYSQVNFWMQKMGYEVPNIPTYIGSIMDELDHYIDYCINLNKRPFECDFISSIGQSNLSINPNIIINLFNQVLREKGYEIDYEKNCLKRIEKEDKNDIDISDISMRLIKLMK